MPKNNSRLSQPKYRADIDGLRAVAVLAVVCFHAFPSWLKGGFIGVDVFFVVSGYLISTIIFESLDRGIFNFSEFYARRIRRIFPALILVLIACFTFGWFALLPDEYKQLGQHIFAGAAFVSNLLLWSEAGYFDNGAETKPLLHLWSLGIEEQFYIIWPLLLWLAWRHKFNLLTIATLLAALSFTLNIMGVGHDKVATFYYPQTRFWELICGSLLAWLTLYKKSSLIIFVERFNKYTPIKFFGAECSSASHFLANVLSFLGISLLIYGFWKFSADLNYPGAWALVPVVGTLFLLIAGSRAWFSNVILSNKITVWFGLISYPLYLWHWPLLSFARMFEGELPSHYIRFLAIAISIILAWLTYKLVEFPIRNSSAKKIVIALMLLMGACGFAGYSTYERNGLDFRFSETIMELSRYKYNHQKEYREGTCFLRSEQKFYAFSNCEIESKYGKKVYLWGDSHAAHLYQGYQKVYGDEFKIVQRTASGCPPILNVNFPNDVNCKSLNSNILKELSIEKPERILLAGLWTFYDLSKLDETIYQLRGMGIKNIDFIGPVPQWKDGLPKQLYMYYKSHLPHVLPARMLHGLSDNFVALDEKLKERLENLGVRYISPRSLLCNESGCLTMVDSSVDGLIAWDYGHLTTKGSIFLVKLFPGF